MVPDMDFETLSVRGLMKKVVATDLAPGSRVGGGWTKETERANKKKKKDDGTFCYPRPSTGQKKKQNSFHPI